MTKPEPPQLSKELLDAILRDDAEAVARQIAAGAFVGADPRHGNTPLRTACQAAALNSIRALIGAGANVNERITHRSPVDKRVEQDFTPIFYATKPEVIELLVERGADVNAISASGLTALMRFAHHGNVECVEAMLRCGADTSPRRHARKRTDPSTALEFAERSLAFWETISQSEPLPNPEQTIERYRRTVALISAAEHASRRRV